MVCNSAQHSILINGVPTEKSKPQKGLRQGDSLSPFIFILVEELFTKLINKVVKLNMISVFQINDITVSRL